MKLEYIKRLVGENTILVTIALVILALVLFAFAYLLEKGITGISFATILASIATALLLSAFSFFIEQMSKEKILRKEVDTIFVKHHLGIRLLQERNIPRGAFTGMPNDILDRCGYEFVIVAYSADNFVERNRTWIINALDSGKNIGLLLLHPDNVQQAEQTEGRDIQPHIQKTLGYCRQLITEKSERAQNLKVRGYAGHFYFTGIFIDCFILQSDKNMTQRGVVSIQLKANFKSQHEGIVMTLRPGSQYSNYYTDSCREIWAQSRDLICSNENNK
jgi:hypothetical protein